MSTVSTLSGSMVDSQKKEAGFLNPANFVTLLRLVLTIAITMMRALGFANLLTFILTVIGGLSDALDGIIARRYGYVTKLGGFLDKGTDKLFTSSQTSFIALVFYSLYVMFEKQQLMAKGMFAHLILILIATLFAEEITLLLGGIWAYRKGLDVKANKWGKRKMITECVLLYYWAIVNDLCPFGLTLDTYFSLVSVTLLLGGCVYYAGKSIDGYWEIYAPYLIADIRDIPSFLRKRLHWQ